MCSCTVIPGSSTLALHTTIQHFKPVQNGFMRQETEVTSKSSYFSYIYIIQVNQKQYTFSPYVVILTEYLTTALCQSGLSIVTILDQSYMTRFDFIFLIVHFCQPAALWFWSAFSFLLSMEAIRQTSDYAITYYKALYRCAWTGWKLSPRHWSLYQCMYIDTTQMYLSWSNVST